MGHHLIKGKDAMAVQFYCAAGNILNSKKGVSIGVLSILVREMKLNQSYTPFFNSCLPGKKIT
jgi:hypothetical protein